MTRLALLLCVVTLPAFAWSDGVEAPPKKYDHAPRVPVSVVETTQMVIDEICGKDTIACQVVDTAPCLILLPGHQPPGKRAHLLRHEQAHCNGWTHSDDLSSWEVPARSAVSWGQGWSWNLDQLACAVVAQYTVGPTHPSIVVPFTHEVLFITDNPCYAENSK